jgi:hypothetical protein
MVGACRIAVNSTVHNSAARLQTMRKTLKSTPACVASSPSPDRGRGVVVAADVTSPKADFIMMQKQASE